MAIQNWTITTLASHIEGQLTFEPNAAGGTVPARMVNIVTRAYYDLWDAKDWLFRRTPATLTLTANTATVDLPDNYAKLDMKWLKENLRRGTLRFTQDVQRFQDLLDGTNVSPGQPRWALIEPKVSETTKFVYQARLHPTPNVAYTYPYIYLRNAPDLGASAIVLWPRPFYLGWELLSMYRAEKAFKDDKSWKDTKLQYDEWLDDAISDKDEGMTADVAAIMSNGDWEALASLNFEEAGYSVFP